MSLVYLVRGSDGQIEMIDAVEHGRNMETSLPRWAIKAANIMWAILQPSLRSAGWLAFAKVDAAAQRGNNFAIEIRQGIRRIAIRLVQRGA